MLKYKVAYITGSRADYGIVRKYLKYLDQDEDIDFSILATGTHLEPAYGKTIEQIIKDGFFVEKEFPIAVNNQNTSEVIKCMASALTQFGAYFEKVRYNLLIVLGDRYEILAATIAAAMHKIPVLHLHGGEITLGNYDEFIRHSITKMSTYHFTSTNTYRNRVIQLGEAPERVFYLGALGAENCKNIEFELIDERIRQLPPKGYFVVAFHPETLTGVDVLMQAQNILQVIKNYLLNYEVVFIGVNADTGGNIIKKEWKAFQEENEGVHYVENLNVDSYLYLIKNAVMLIGNSSSGIIEAPTLGTYTVNIGDRQKGRVAGRSVLSIPCQKEALSEAIEKIFASLKKGETFDNPYYKENAARNYYKKTKDILDNIMKQPKNFYDIKYE